jgi:hypothetical protein
MNYKAWLASGALGAAIGGASVVGCTLGVSGTGPEADASLPDAPFDSTGIDAAPDGAEDAIARTDAADHTAPDEGIDSGHIGADDASDARIEDASDGAPRADASDARIEDASDGAPRSDASDDGAPADGSEASVSDASDAAPADASDATVSDASDGEVVDAGIDAASCAGVLCNGSCVFAPDCRMCPGAPLLCAPAGTCVSTCAACRDPADGGLPIECFACNDNQGPPIGTCAVADAAQYCLSGSYAQPNGNGRPTFHCPCPNHVSADCPGATQVCAPDPNGPAMCLTCGEMFPIDLTGANCNNGKVCNAGSAVCQ